MADCVSESSFSGLRRITFISFFSFPKPFYPEIFEALESGLNLAKEVGADLMLATDPDADRVGIAMKLSLIHIWKCNE